MHDKENKITKVKLAVSYSLKARMLVSFGLLLVMALLSIEISYIYGVPFTGFGGELEENQTEAFRELNIIADLKKERLLRWIEERKDDSTILAKSIAIRKLMTEVQVFIDEKRAEGHAGKELWGLLQNTDAHKDLTSHLDLTASAYGVYDEIEIAELGTGLVFASTVHDELGENVAEWAYFEEVNSSKEIFVHFEREDPRNGTHKNRYALHFSRVISLVGLEKKAVLIMHIDPTDFIEPMLHTGEGLGRTGEALLVNSDVKILANLKYALADGISAEPLIYKIKAKPAILATQGKEGIILAKDYRNVEVLAAYRHIRINPETGWGLVVKEDRREVFSHLRESIVYSSAIGFFIILASLGIIYIIAGRLSRPINSLSNAARRIEGGDFGARADISASGEILSLAETFNSMAAKVQNWHDELENEIKSRTNELLTENAVRKKAEATLRETNERLGSLINASPLALIIFDPKAKVRMWNPAAERIFGWSEQEVIGKSNPIVPADKMDEAKALLKKVLSGEKVVNLELVRQKKDGTLIHVSLSTAALAEADEDLLFTLAIFDDITVRKKAESALIEREFWLSESQRAAQIGSYDLDISSGKWTCTNVLNEIFGIDDSYDKTVEGWVGIIHPDDKEEMLNYLQDIIAGKVNFDKDYRIIRVSDKVERWVYGRGEANVYECAVLFLPDKLKVYDFLPA